MLDNDIGIRPLEGLYATNVEFIRINLDAMFEISDKDRLLVYGGLTANDCICSYRYGGSQSWSPRTEYVFYNFGSQAGCEAYCCISNCSKGSVALTPDRAGEPLLGYGLFTNSCQCTLQYTCPIQSCVPIRTTRPPYYFRARNRRVMLML